MFNKIKNKIKKVVIFINFLKWKKIKLNVGSAGVTDNGSWFPTDIDTLDITKENDWKKFLWFFRANNIMAEHVWEHLNESDTEFANKNCFKFLKNNGILRIAVPDGFHPDQEYIEYVRPGGNGAGADDHKNLYNYKMIKEMLEKTGFTVNLLEYWDENGKFNYVNWDDENGHIRRSRRYDPRNTDGILKYTSLIVDAVKI